MKTIVAVSLVAASAATAGTVQFFPYTNNSGTSNLIDTSVTISATASTVTFTLNNNTTAGRVDIFYIESGAALAGVDASSFVITNTPAVPDGQVSFGPGGAPPFPGGIPNWTKPNFFSMSATTPQSAANGLSLGDVVSVTFNHDGTFSLAALMASISDGSIRMAQHYLGWGPGGEGSEWLVTIVPLPPAAWAGLGMLGLVAGVRTLRRR